MLYKLFYTTLRNSERFREMKRINPVLLASPVLIRERQRNNNRRPERNLTRREAQCFKTCSRYGRRGGVVAISSVDRNECVVLQPDSVMTGDGTSSLRYVPRVFGELDDGLGGRSQQRSACICDVM